MTGPMTRWLQHGACLGLMLLVAVVGAWGQPTAEVVTADLAPHERFTETTPDQLASVPVQAPTIPQARQ